MDSFLKKWTDKNGLRDSEASVILKALEAQRHLLLMFTSCAWFFDEVSGIETIQNLQYAYRAIELSERAFGIKLLEPFMKDLESAESNLPEIESGREAFEKYALPSRVDNLKVGSHFAVASIFENFGIKNEVYNNKITLIEFLRLKSGKAHVAFGHARIRSRTTLDRNHILFGVLHFGDHNISGGIKKFESQEEYENLVSDARRTFEHADFPATLRIIDSFFGTNRYSLRDLFKDEQRKFIDIIMNEAMTETEERFQRLYRNNYSLLTYLTNMNIPVPKVFSDISEFVQNRGLKSSLGTDAPIRISNVRGYLDEARKWQVPIDGVGVAHELEDVLEQKMDAFAADDTNFSKLLEILQLVELSEEMPSKVNLGPVQNWFWLWYRDHKSPENPTTIQRELENVARQLADRLKIRLPAKERLENETIEPAVSGDLSPSASKDISV
ncbi:MAG: DUF3536 domain-containing protein [Proteobacteria bacterium]|nr:MAG: DUF3536 domain-containing protein [Pseudomonadota bacterium]